MPIKTDIMETVSENSEVSLTLTVSGGAADTGPPDNDRKLLITNSVGYLGGILKVTTSSANLSTMQHINIGWRPRVNADPGRYLPLFIDLKDSNTPVGDLPDYTPLVNLEGDQFTAGRMYYVYFTHPETPAAIPLFKDFEESTIPYGIEFRATATGENNDEVLDLEIRVFATIWPAT